MGVCLTDVHKTQVRRHWLNDEDIYFVTKNFTLIQANGTSKMTTPNKCHLTVFAHYIFKTKQWIADKSVRKKKEQQNCNTSQTWYLLQSNPISIAN